MIGIIVAMNVDRLIGTKNSIPWKYKGDMARFKRLTMNSTVIMGRKTWESIPVKFRPLEGRHNIVVKSNALAAKPQTLMESLYDIKNPTETSSVAQALSLATLHSKNIEDNIWFIGGANIYREAMCYADIIDITHVPDIIECNCGVEDSHSYGHMSGCNLFDEVHFPIVDPAIFTAGYIEQHPDEPELKIQRFVRKSK